MNTLELKSCFEGDRIRAPKVCGFSDLNHAFQLITEKSAGILGYKSIDHAIGDTAYDVPSDLASSASQWHSQNSRVIRTRAPMQIIDIHEYANRLNAFILEKVPVVEDDSSELVGVFCCGQELLKTTAKRLTTNLFTNMQKYINQNKPVHVSYDVISKFDELTLTVRESECLFYVIRGRSLTTIAGYLNLSARTIESHINNIKIKLDCNSKQAIIDCAFALNLLYKIPKSLLT